jgi:hypothetical protein
MKKIISLSILLFIATSSFSQIRLSDLNVKGSISGTEKIPVSGSGNPGITPNLFKTFLGFAASSATTGFTSFQAPPLLSNTPLTANFEIANVGNILSQSDNIITNNVWVGNVAGRGVFARNVRWNVALGKYITPDLTASAYGGALLEIGGEGVSLHASPVGSHFGDVRSLGLLVSANGPRGVTGVTTGNYTQSINQIFAQYQSAPGAIYSWASGLTPMVYLLSQELKGTAGTDTQNEFIRLQTNSGTATAYPSFKFQTSNGVIATPTSISTGRVTGEIGANAYGGAYRHTASMRFVASGTVDGSGAGQSVTFLTSPNTVSNLAERMRIDEAGGIGLGVSASITAFADIAAGTTARASLRFREGVAPTSPNDGELWKETTNDRLMFRKGASSEEIISAIAVNSVSPTSPNRTIQITFNGTTYYIAAKTTND